MTLYGSSTSPFVRKIRVLLIEKDIPCEWVVENPTDPDSHVQKLNPLGKVPVFVRTDGEVLFDSPVIAEYLDSLKGAPLFPAAGEARWQALRWHALGQGIADAAVARLMESRRPADKQYPKEITRQEGKIAAALKFAEQHLPKTPYVVGTALSIGDIGLGVALGYVDFRYPHDWRRQHPRLAEWFKHISARASFVETAPPVN